MRAVTVLTIVVAALMLAGCGGSDQTAAAAKCLRNALASQALGDSSQNCADSTAASAGGQNMPPVTCTKQTANQYVCKTGSLSFDPFHLSNQFYSVTYDGKSIVYQQTQ